MKEMLSALVERIGRLFEVKSLVTLSLTAALVVMLFHTDTVPSELLALFSTTYGAVITYFFTRKGDKGDAAGE